MSITVSDPIDVVAGALDDERVAAAPTTSPAFDWARRVGVPIVRRARMLIMSSAVWVLYVPHYTVLWILGPRWGMYWVRLAAKVHWLLTFVGAQRFTRLHLEELAPMFRCRESVSEILLKHLELKHECFARVRVYGVQSEYRGQEDVQWSADPTCLDALPKVEARACGLIFVGFHFGCFQMSAVMPQLLPGCNPLQLRFRDAQCAEMIASPIARMALRKAMEADRRSGSQILYVDADTNLMPVFRMLRGGGSVAVAADGMIADDFVDVPFFDGYLRVPSGWARLAGSTRSEIVVIFDRGIVDGLGHISFVNQITCDGRSTEALESAVAHAIHILEDQIREVPWCWHPWQRLRRECDADGVTRYFLQQFSTARTAASLRRFDSAPINVPSSATGVKCLTGATERPRVAILCNSLTPYRVHLHERIVDEVPEIELWSLATHGNAYDRWVGANIPQAILPVNFGDGEPTNEQTLLRYSLREWRKAGRIIRWLQEHKVSAVFCQGCGDVGRLRVLWWCNRHGIPCFLTGDFNVCADLLTGAKRWAKRQVYQRAIEWSVGLLPCGSYGKALFDRYGGDKKPAFDFPFVPDPKLFLKPPSDAVAKVGARYGFKTDRRRIVFSARMSAVKRPDLALAAFAAIANDRPDWDLVMLGDGVLRESLEGSVPTSLRERVRWLGFVHDPKEVAAIYAQCDILILPSDREPWGVVVVEAASAGLAIVATDIVGAAPELIHPGRNGKLFPAGDLNALTKSLRDATESAWISAAKPSSREVYREWIGKSDPVTGFRSALEHCSVSRSNSRDRDPVANRTTNMSRVAALTAGEIGAAAAITL